MLALTVVGPAPVPASTPGRLALAGLGALTAWTALSILWAPVAGVGVQDVQRLLLYVGVVLLAVGALRDARVQRAAEPALAAGAAIVIGYGLSGRLLPGLIHLDHSRSAGGRLEQPLTYWNAEGALAAIGLVLCARLAGDRSRPAPSASPPRRRRPSSPPASTSPTRAARSSSRRSACSCSSRPRRRGRSCARRPPRSRAA